MIKSGQIELDAKEIIAKEFLRLVEEGLIPKNCNLHSFTVDEILNSVIIRYEIPKE
jgi:hypothetical protein